ncbi:hypothetical protein KA183_09100 [bacterium]|nr:hypothetical protein [bacterium]QQR56803.1 MAG: hypothetical protein IPG59_17655 [Candidatus Melainabacteria bacterium]
MAIETFFILLIIAVGTAMLARLVLPHSVPGGIFSCAAVGFCGAWMGASSLFHLGPDLAGVPLFASVIGSVVFTFFFSMISGGSSNSWD